MAFDPKVFSQVVFNALYESNRFFNKCNRAYDGLVTTPWAKSVDVPIMPVLTVSKVAVAHDAAARKRGSDIETVNVPFTPYIVPLACTVEDAMATNDQLLNKMSEGVVAAYEQELDKDVYAAAVSGLPAGNKIAKKGTELSNKDLSSIRKWFISKRIPASNRYCAYHVDLEDEFNDIDVVKNAQSANRELLEQGITYIRGIYYFASADVPLVAGKAPLLGMWAPSIAVVLKGTNNGSTLTRETDYVSGSGVKVADYIAYGGIKRTYDNGVVIVS